MSSSNASSTAVGWTCPSCGKGNAPLAMKCGHCVTTSNQLSKGAATNLPEGVFRDGEMPLLKSN